MHDAVGGEALSGSEAGSRRNAIGGNSSSSGEGARLRAENETLRARLSRLSEAILRISEDLDLDTVLQEVADGARLLTGARYTALTTHTESGEPQDVLISGLTDQETERILAFTSGPALFGYLSRLRQPLRTRNFVAHTEAAGFPGFPLEIGAFLSTQIRVRDRHVGNIYIGEKEVAGEFTPRTRRA